jgi:hypothetical protein
MKIGKRNTYGERWGTPDVGTPDEENPEWTKDDFDNVIIKRGSLSLVEILRQLDDKSGDVK